MPRLASGGAGFIPAPGLRRRRGSHHINRTILTGLTDALGSGLNRPPPLESADPAALAAWRSTADLSNLVHDGAHARTRFHHGLIAQDVQALLADQGIDFGGFQDHAVNGGQDVLSLGYDEFIAPIIKAIQELAPTLDAVGELRAVIAAQHALIESQQDRIAALERAIAPR